MDSKPLLSILVCHSDNRKVQISRMKLSILHAICSYSSRTLDILKIGDSDTFLAMPISPIKSDNQYYIELRINDEKGITIGHKRNKLLSSALGKYVCFLDDDDMIMPHFFSQVIDCLTDDYDCASLIGKSYEDGVYKSDFIHSIKYKEYSSENNVLVRPPNHLNIIKSEIAKKYSFNDKSYGEDTEWAMEIAKSGILKKEYEVSLPLYYYDKRTIQDTPKSNQNSSNGRFN